MLLSHIPQCIIQNRNVDNAFYKWCIVEYVTGALQDLLNLLMLEMEYSSYGSQYLACWCSGSYSRQSINRHGFGCVGQTMCIIVSESISWISVKPNPWYYSQHEYIFCNLSISSACLELIWFITLKYCILWSNLSHFSWHINTSSN